MKKFNKILSLLVALMIAVSAILLVSCGTQKTTDTEGASKQESPAGTPSSEQFAYTITFLVVDAEGKTETFEIQTNEKYLRGALESRGLIKGSESSYGMMVTEVNGIRADYTLDGAYWALYIGEDYAMEGVDKTELRDGAIYKFVYTKA